MAKYLFGVDVGGTTVKLGLFTPEGELVDKWEIVTRKEDCGDHIIGDIAESIREEAAKKDIAFADVVGVGIGVPGPVTDDGTVLMAANLGWGERHITSELSEILGVPVKAGNDANVAALGEMWRGGGKGYDDMVAVTLGTGVGGGIIINGKIVCGATGAGGEIGHIHLEDDEPDECGCKGHGCLEQYASATGVVRIAGRKLAESDKPSVLRDKDFSAKDVWDAVKAGDALAVEVAEVYGEYLGKGLAAVANVVNPEIFVIGGGVSRAGQILIDYMKPYYDRYVFPGARGAKFALATLGNDAGIYGSAKLVYDTWKD
ncbi:MAG: ROK family glucokinase [Lachnospiraceae bacterium]|nr:ROK family glucokinase [Lachnospiraceae bacterium]